MHVAANVVVSNLRIVELAGGTTCLPGFKELEEAVAILALRLFVHVDDCLVDVVA